MVFALTVERVLDAFLFTETIAAFMGIMFMGGILWKRANRYGAFTGTVSAFALYYALNYLMSCRPSPDAAPFQTLSSAFTHLTSLWGDGQLGGFLSTGDMKLIYPWTAASFGWAMLVGFSVLIGVSLCTKAEDGARIARFFGRMRRAPGSQPMSRSLPMSRSQVELGNEAQELQLGNEAQTTPDGTPALAADRGEDLILVDLPGWLTSERWRGFFHRYREDLVGFALGWLTVGLLVFLAWGIVSIGA